ncbi:MAG: amino acid-binding protein [Spirochaetes bacterium]|nr:MAG: amino acid-binding protein [Spirochaetota bacterium]
MNVTQLSLFLENKPGRLQSALKVLSDNKINIMTLTIAEVSDFGIVRLVVNKPDEAVKALRAQSFTCSTTEVLAIEIEDVPGALARALDIFGTHKLNIEYMYAFTEKRNDKAVMIFRFDDIEAAKKALADEGYQIVKKIDIIGE